MARPLYILHRERSISPQSGHLNDCFYVSRCLEIPHMTSRINICSSHSSHLSSSNLFVVDLVFKAMAALAQIPTSRGWVNNKISQRIQVILQRPSPPRVSSYFAHDGIMEKKEQHVMCAREADEVLGLRTLVLILDFLVGLSVRWSRRTCGNPPYNFCRPLELCWPIHIREVSYGLTLDNRFMEDFCHVSYLHSSRPG